MPLSPPLNEDRLFLFPLQFLFRLQRLRQQLDALPDVDVVKKLLRLLFLRCRCCFQNAEVFDDADDDSGGRIDAVDETIGAAAASAPADVDDSTMAIWRLVRCRYCG